MSLIKYIQGTDVQPHHVGQAILLDRLVYEDIYYVDLSTCAEYLAVNPDIYFMALNEENTVIGYVNFSPITEDTHRKLKSGSMIDSDITGANLVSYRPNQRLYGYFSSIVVHPAYRNRGIGTTLIETVVNFLVLLAERENIVFREIIADVVSNDGACMMNKLGFQKETATNHRSEIMVLNPASKQCIKTKLNERLLRVYDSYAEN